MKYFLVLLISVLFGTCANKKATTVFISQKSDTVSSESVPVKITTLSNDSIVTFFKVHSVNNALPPRLSGDSLANFENNESYPIDLLSFINDEFHKEFEPLTFSPLSYEYDSENKIHWFYVYLKSSHLDENSENIFLFTCDADLKPIDHFCLAQKWYFGNSDRVRSYKRMKSSIFLIKEHENDVQSEGGDLIKYPSDEQFKIMISNSGKIEIKK